MVTPFFDYEGITFNRSKIQVVSGPTIDHSQPGHLPFFRVILEHDVEWQITAPTDEELLTRRAAFITALTN